MDVAMTAISTPAITTRTIQANGLTFAIDETGVSDDIALCLHGFPESRYAWRHQLAPLAAMGWHAVAPDLRGYGDSSRPSGLAPYALHHLVEDVAALFDALGARRRLLIAHDWGAAIAWAFAIKRVRPLDGLVIMNVPHPAIFRAVLARSWAQRRRSWYILFFQIPRLPEAMLTARGAAAIGRMFSGMAIDKSAFPPDVTDHYRANALKPGAMTAMLAYYRANARSLGRATQSPMIEVPTLMIWGEADAALGLELTEGYAPYVEDFTLNRLPRVSHWVQQEAPGPVNEKLRDWMRAKGLILAER